MADYLGSKKRDLKRDDTRRNIQRNTRCKNIPFKQPIVRYIISNCPIVLSVYHFRKRARTGVAIRVVSRVIFATKMCPVLRVVRPTVELWIGLTNLFAMKFIIRI